MSPRRVRKGGVIIPAAPCDPGSGRCASGPGLGPSRFRRRRRSPDRSPGEAVDAGQRRWGSCRRCPGCRCHGGHRNDDEEDARPDRLLASVMGRQGRCVEESKSHAVRRVALDGPRRTRQRSWCLAVRTEATGSSKRPLAAKPTRYESGRRRTASRCPPPIPQ